MEINAENLRKIRAERGMNQTEFANLLGISYRSYQNYEAGSNIPDAKKLLIATKLSAENVQNSGGIKGIKVTRPSESFKTKAGSEYEELPNGKYKLTVPFVPVRAQARYLMDYSDAEFISDLEDMTFIVDRVGNGRYLAFEIQNDSMDDNTKNSIPDGAVVLARELGRQHWTSKFRTNQYPYWIIVHKTTILCKEIVNHDTEKGIITCHSLNESPEYQDFELKLDDVHQLFNIVKKTF